MHVDRDILRYGHFLPIARDGQRLIAKLPNVEGGKIGEAGNRNCREDSHDENDYDQFNKRKAAQWRFD